MTREAAGNCLCGIAVSLHFDDQNRMRGCAWAAKQIKPVDKGRLFKLKIQKNHEARQAALQSIRPTPRGWSVKIGGAVKGKTVVMPSKERAVQAVNDHYNDAMMAVIEHRKF